MSSAESRDFRISNNMIFHLIFSQAGTIGKAFAELVMNSMDARSSVFELFIDTNGFKAVDQGRGFRTREEIESWFEELGFEHTSDLHQEGDRFSRFGLGRAQIMAFAGTRWHTNSFIMDVDIKARGMGYELSVDQPQVDGCTVEGQWYDPLSFTDLKSVLQELEALVAYAGIEVKVNGNIITKKNVKWDYETDQVFIKRRETGDLHVYNQGILVRSYPSNQYGSGIVVSKVPFTLNMARNDILLSKCSVWKEVRTFLREDAGNRSRNKTRLNDDDRELLLNQWIDGEVDHSKIENCSLIEDCSGRKWKLSTLLYKVLTVHTEGPKLAADRIQQTKVAFVIAQKMMDIFGVEKPENLIKRIEALINRDREGTYFGPVTLEFTHISELLESNNTDHMILKDKELNKTERVALAALSRGVGNLQDAVYSATSTNRGDKNRRKLYIGESNASKAWTDGATFIALNRNLIRDHIRDGFRGFTYLANVMVHELVHEQNTATNHGHGSEFYEIFHDVLCGQHSLAYGTAVRVMMADFLGRAQKQGLKLSRNELRDLDREVEIEREIHGSSDFSDHVNEAAA